MAFAVGMVALATTAGTNTPIRCVADLKAACQSEISGVPFEVAVRVNACYDRVICTTVIVRDDADNAFSVKFEPGVSYVPVPGDRVLMAGMTEREAPYPTLAVATSIRLIEHGTPDKPLSVRPSDATDKSFDFKYLRLEGTVREAFRDEIDDRCFFLMLTDGKSISTAVLETSPNSEKRIGALIGAKISICGNYNPNPSSTRLKHGRTFFILEQDGIKVLEPAPDDPFEIADRQRISGRVIAVWHGNRVLIKTENGEICRADLIEPPAPRFGDEIEIAGFHATDLYHDNLTRAIWRVRARTSGEKPEEQIDDTTVRHILSVGNNDRRGINPTYHGRSIRLRGTVRGTPTKDGHLSLECDGYLLPVDGSALGNVFADISEGCQVALSGTCVMEIPNWHADEPFPHIEGIMLVIRTPDDIRVIARPPWWTVARLFTAIGILLLAMLFVLIWNVMLRKRAELRGRELLKEQLEHVKADLKIEERSRLSVELHDSLAQNLAGVSMEIEAANLLRAEDPNAMSEHLLAAKQTLQSCRDELRNCLWDLRSQALEETDMNTAIRRTLLPHVKNTHVAVRFNIPRSELPDNIAHAILQVIRELTVNAVRHGKATSIRIAGDLTDKILMFSVSDNGCGFDPTNRPGVAQGHFGLQGIRERIQKLNGTVRIDSKIGHGTKAVVILAVAEPKGEAPQNSET